MLSVRICKGGCGRELKKSKVAFCVKNHNRTLYAMIRGTHGLYINISQNNFATLCRCFSALRNVYVDSVRRDLGGKVITGEAVERVVSRKVSYKYGSVCNWLWECGCLNFEQGRHCTCNITL